MTTATNQMGEIFETFVTANKVDTKGREIGFIVGFNDNGVEFFAWVQNSRKENGVYGNFGPVQRSVKFKTAEAANVWAYATAKERISKLR